MFLNDCRNCPYRRWNSQKECLACRLFELFDVEAVIIMGKRIDRYPDDGLIEAEEDEKCG